MAYFKRAEFWHRTGIHFRQDKMDSRNRALFPIKGKQVSLKSLSKLTIPGKGHPLLSHLGKQAVDSFRSFEEALVTEDQEYDVIALPEQRRWQPVPRD